MIWYILGGLIGIIFFKKKYKLSFWEAVSCGFIFSLGLYFSFGAITSVLILVLELEEYSDTTVLGFIIYVLLAIGSFSLLKRIKRNRLEIDAEKNEKSKTQSTKYPQSIEKVNYQPGDTIETNVAGVTFEGRQDVIKNLKLGQTIKLIREHNNRYDNNAIKITTIDNKSIGYINRKLAEQIAPIIDEQLSNEINGNVSSIYHVKDEPSIVAVKIRFQLLEENRKVEGLTQPKILTPQIFSELNCPVCNTNEKIAEVRLIYDSRNGSPNFLSMIAPPIRKELSLPEDKEIPNINLPKKPQLYSVPNEPEKSNYWRGAILIGTTEIFFGFLVFYIKNETEWSLKIPILILSFLTIAFVILLILDSIHKPRLKEKFLEEKKRLARENNLLLDNWEKDVEKQQQCHKRISTQIKTENIKNKEEYELEKKIQEEKLSLWNKLFFCYRDETIFIPNSEDYERVENLNEFLEKLARGNNQI